MFSDMSISRRLFVNLAMILSMVVLLFVVAFIAMRRESTARNATQAAMDAVQAFEKIKNQIVQNRLNLRNYALTGSPTYTDEINNGKGRLKQLIAEAEAKSDGISLSGLAQAEERWHQNYAAPLIQKRLQVEAGMDVNLFQAYFMKLEDEYHDTSFDQISAATDAVNQKLKDRRDADQNKALFTTALLIVVAIAVVAGSGFVSYRTAKSITDPLRQLITVTREIGEEGDLEQEIGIRRSDEIGELALHFSSMVGYLREMAVISEAIAGGDLSHEVAPRSSRDTLGHAFARMTEGLSTLAKNVRDTAAQVATGSGGVANASEEAARTALTASSAIDEVTSTMQEMTINVQNMVRSTQLQSGSVNNTSSSIDQMVASIQRVTDTAKVLLDISDRSRQEMQAGIASMDKTTDGLNRINSSIQGAAGIINVLGQRADDIGKIIEVIDDLAEQTNLLALNAAIEAARAGEHGLGFAVVADEVRKLAEKSAQSTKEISTLIQSIQQEARKAVQNMDQSTVIVNEGLMLGGDLSGALRKTSSVVAEVYKFAQEIGAATNEQSAGSSRIAGNARRLNEITSELSSSVEEQAMGSQAVVKAMERMRALVQQSTSGSTELAASAEQMSKMSRKLLNLVDRFKLESVHAEPAPIASSAVSGRR